MDNFTDSLNAGITPAYAGNTKRVSKIEDTREDHPRLRGEHQWITLQIVLMQGSPPPTRGTQAQGRKNPLSGGITPAYAGNT